MDRYSFKFHSLVPAGNPAGKIDPIQPIDELKLEPAADPAK